MAPSETAIRRTRADRLGAQLLWAPLLLLFAGLILPVVWLLATVLAPGGVDVGALLYRLVTVPLYWTVLVNTLRISAVVTVGCVVVGYPLAATLVLASPRMGRILFGVLMSSLWLSLLVRSYAWSVLLQANGPIARLLVALGRRADAPSLMYSRGAVVVGMIHVLAPIMVLVLVSNMRSRTNFLRTVAESLGASRTFYLVKIFLAGTGSATLAGAILVFLLSVGFYITPALLGGGKGQTMMFAMLIEEQMVTLGNWAMAAALALVLMTAVLSLLAATWLLPSLRSQWKGLLGHA